MIEIHISFLLLSQYMCNQMLQSHSTKLQFRHVVLLKSHELSHFLIFWLLFEAATILVTLQICFPHYSVSFPKHRKFMLSNNSGLSNNICLNFVYTWPLNEWGPLFLMYNFLKLLASADIYCNTDTRWLNLITAIKWLQTRYQYLQYMHTETCE